MNPDIRAAYNNCKPHEWLEYGDERYVPLSEQGLRGSDGDIMDDLRRAIRASDEATQLLISGFRGSGKTTELKKLEHKLNNDGFHVVYVDTEDYLNLTMPVTVSDLWISIAAGFDVFLQNLIPAEHAIGRFWERVTAFLKREVEISDLKLKIPEVGELEVALRENRAFRTALNHALEAKRPELVQECRDFVEEGIAVLAQIDDKKSGTVIIVDSFEKLVGDPRNAKEVRLSVETIFSRDWKLLRTPCHVVYTVPPWLAFTAVDNELGRTRLLPMCKVKNKNGEACKAGVQAIFNLLNKRMDVSAIFGDDTAINLLIENSGGYPRDLLRLVRETLLRNMDADTIPVPKKKLQADMDRVIEIYRESFDTGLDGNDLPLLVKIAKDKDISGWTREEKFRLAELFDRHFVLSYQNGKRWLDLHPLLRESVSMQSALKDV